jgi:single-strand DNA-binding protein
MELRKDKMANFNQVILIGNITRDPQLSYLPSQTAVCDFGIAVNKKFKGQDGQMKEKPCFVDLKAFGKTGEAINKYCKKGNPLFIRGELSYDSWTAKDGTKKSKLSVIIDSFQFIGGKPNTDGTTANDMPDEPQGEQPQASGEDIPF